MCILTITARRLLWCTVLCPAPMSLAAHELDYDLFSQQNTSSIVQVRRRHSDDISRKGALRVTPQPCHEATPTSHASVRPSFQLSHLQLMPSPKPIARHTMRRQAASLWSASSPLIRSRRDGRRPIEAIGRRGVKIYATPSSSAPAAQEVAVGSGDAGRTPGMHLRVMRMFQGGVNANEQIDAKFEVVGAPFSMLSVQLSPSQNLYTRRGTLVAVSGKAENVCF